MDYSPRVERCKLRWPDGATGLIDFCDQMTPLSFSLIAYGITMVLCVAKLIIESSRILPLFVAGRRRELAI
jgi:hypothetical protein